MIRLDKAGLFEILPDYDVVIPDVDNITLTVSFDYDKLPREHPNVPWVDGIAEFKHCRKDGSKYWTAKAMREYYVSIPREAFYLHIHKGYSYPRFTVNGVEITMSTSGIGNGRWTDVVGERNSITCNTPKATYYKLLEVCTSIPQTLTIENREWWMDLRNESLGVLNPGDVVLLKKGLSPEKLTFEKMSSKSKKSFACVADRAYYTVGRSRIDWIKTNEANGRQSVEPMVKS